MEMRQTGSRKWKQVATVKSKIGRGEWGVGGENRRTGKPTENGSESHLRPNELPHPQPPGPLLLTPDG